MTDAQSKRTRLAVWKAILTAVGGTPAYNDTLYRTIRKAAEAAGAAVQCCTPPASRLLIHKLVTAMGGTPGFNDTIYMLERQILILTGTVIPCCNLPPIQVLGAGSAGNDGILLGNPDEDFVFGDPDSGTVFGH